MFEHAGLQGTSLGPTGLSDCDLRRLRKHGLITRVAGTHRYQVTNTGLERALFLTRAHDRLLRTGLAQLADQEPRPLRSANRTYQTALDTLTREAGLAA